MLRPTLHPTCKLLLWFLCIPLILTAAPADVLIDSITVHGDELCVSYRSILLDDRAITGLQNGFTSVALHQVFLWKHKGLFSKQVQEKNAPRAFVV